MQSDMILNRNAIDRTLSNGLYAIFTTRLNHKYAVKEISPNIYKTYKWNNDGYYEPWEQLANFLIWNGYLQGFEDIEKLIEN